MKRKRLWVFVAIGLVLLCCFVLHFMRAHARLTIRGHIIGLTGLEFSADGSLLVSAAHDGRVKVWSPTTGELKSTLQLDHGVASLSLSPRSHVAALSLVAESNEVLLWPFTEGAAYRLLSTGHTRSVTCVAFSPDGNLLASGSLDGAVRLCDVRLASSTKAPVMHGGAVLSVVFSPNGECVASGGEDGAVLRWDIGSGLQRPILRADQHFSKVRALAVSPDSRMIAVGDDDQNVTVVDLASGEIIRILRCSEDNAIAPYRSVNALRFSPHGSLLACGGNETWGIRVWETRSWQLCNSYRRHRIAVRCVAFSPDGNTLASGDFGGDIMLWDVNEESLSKDRQ